METKPIKFKKLSDNFAPPDVPVSYIGKVNDLLEFLNSGHELARKIDAVYRLLDEIAPFVASFASCSKGCAHCCHVDVQMTTLEAEYINIKTGITHNIIQGTTTGNNSACPFLTPAGECGIYAMRPILCRTYHALGDPAFCATGDAERIEYGSVANNYGNNFYATFVGWMRSQNDHLGGELKDIRNFFPRPREEVQEYLASRLAF